MPRNAGLSYRTFTPRTFHRLGDAWRALEHGPDMTAFQTFDWAALVNEKFLRERASRYGIDLRYVLIERDDTPLLIAPWRFHRMSLSPGHPRGVHLIGRNGPADYLNFIYTDFEAAAAERALTHAVEGFGNASFNLERILAGTSAHAWLTSIDGATERRENAVRLALPADADTYAKLLSKSTRQNIRTAWNRARADGVALEVSVASRLGAAEADDLAALKWQREASRRQRHSSPRDRLVSALRTAYFRSLFTPYDESRAAMTNLSRPFVLRVSADGQTAAFAFGLGDRFGGQRTLRLLQVGIDEAFARYSPGLIGLHHFITGELEAGRPTWDVIDFTRGEERYKFQLGGTAHAYSDVAYRWRGKDR